ncbi:MAG: HNH endonuclease [Pyrinomonadaceae bacterium]|nr:HNH endonuclease [Pyrinomonadaceae bacterium]
MNEKRNIPAKLRRTVKARARELCEYCRSREDYSTQSFCYEHILPRVAGGATAAENLAYSCQGCNSHKATRIEAVDYLTDRRVKLFNPRQMSWREHFRWSEDFSEAVGITPIGRATVEALKLNRHGLVNLRRVLYAIGKHPPLETANEE